jgi:hypothetical protein
MVEMTAAQRVLRARMGGLATSAAGHVTTAPARSAFLGKFYADIPADLPERERDRRAAAARRLHFTRLALRSSISRSRHRKAGPAVGTPGPAASMEGTRDAAST